jgi:hypothetical protein
VELGGGRLEELQAPSCLLTEGEIAGRVLFLGTKRKLGHVSAGSMLDALSMATLMRRIVDDAHGYSPSANPEAQQWRLGAESGRGAVRSHRAKADRRW